MMNATKTFDPELLKAIEGWKRLKHTELAIACQAFYTLAMHGDSPQWIRNAAEAIARDVAEKVMR